MKTKSDSQLKADVLDELKCEPTLDDTEVGVRVTSGVVTLSGTVSAYPQKLAAVEAARTVYGVLHVVDEMRTKTPTASERADRELASAVRHALKWDVLVPDDRIVSVVSSGSVTLRGSVDTWTQRYHAENCVQRLTGVKAVVNQINVAAEPVSPGQVKSQIEQTLGRQSEREAKRIGVFVHDGVVTLTGTLRSWGEKSAIERAVFCAPGVRRVDDRTTVDPYQ